MKYIPEFEFTPFEEGESFQSSIITLRRKLTLPLTATALDLSVKWFMENYETARTGIKKA